MRVLQTSLTPVYAMGKKKHKLRKVKGQNAEPSDSSDEGGGATGASGQNCSHIRKGVNFASMRKAVLKQTFAECQSCGRDTTPPVLLAKYRQQTSDNLPLVVDGDSSQTGEDEVAEEETVWVCLQCGFQGCGRGSTNKHALKHYNTPHSSCHSVVINVNTWAVWCYACDDDLLAENSKRLRECLEFLRKQGTAVSLPASLIDNKKLPCESSSPMDSTLDQSTSTMSKSRSGSLKGPTGAQGIALCQKVKGLSNLGNTCFFNAVMQNLSQTPCLETLIVDKVKKGVVVTLAGHPALDKDIDEALSDKDDDQDGENSGHYNKELSSIDVSLSEGGPLTQSVVGFLKDMSQSGKSSTVNPSSLFGQICKKAPRFKGYQQQDSHELLRYLLDNVKTEEIRRCQLGILKYFKLPENINPRKVDDEIARRVKAYGQLAKHSFLESLFGGQLISTVECNDCLQVSQVFEPFLDLSLSVTEEKPARPNVAVLGKTMTWNTESTSHAAGELLGKSSNWDDKPNKQQERKLKKAAKKEQKRRNRSSKKVNIFDDDPADSQQTNNEDVATRVAAPGVQRIQNEASQDSDDTSDADVEDNLESDVSRNRNNSIPLAKPEDTTNLSGGDSSPRPIGSNSAKINSMNSGRERDANIIHAASSVSNSIPKQMSSSWQGSDVSTKNTYILPALVRKSDSDLPASNIKTDHLQSTVDKHTERLESNCVLENRTSCSAENEKCDVNDDFEKCKNKMVFSSYDDKNSRRIIVNADANDGDWEFIEKKNSQSLQEINELTQKMYVLDLKSPDINGCLATNDSSRETRHDSPGDIDTNITSISCGRAESFVNISLPDMNESKNYVLSKSENSLFCFTNDSRCGNATGVSRSLENGLESYGAVNPSVSCIKPSVMNMVEAQHGNMYFTREAQKTCDKSAHSQTAALHNNDPSQSVGVASLHNNTSQTIGPMCHETVHNDISQTTDHTKVHTDISHSAGHRNTPTGNNCITLNTSVSNKPNTENRKMADLRRAAQQKSIETLGERYQPEPLECSVMSCLNQFTSAELLTGTNKFGCENCTRIKDGKKPGKKDKVYSNASKRYRIFFPPAVLTLHFKRFEQVGYTSRKVNRHVNFPFILDISSFCSALSQGISKGQRKVLYSLYGVVEHSGRLNAGHYTAYVKVRPCSGLIANFLQNYTTARPTNNPKDFVRWYRELYDNGVDSIGKRRMSTDTMENATDVPVPPGRWYHISDNRVNEVTESSVQKAQAYILFYERIY